MIKPLIKFFTKYSIGFYISCGLFFIALVFAFVAVLFSVSSTMAKGYEIEEMGLIIFLSVAAMLLLTMVIASMIIFGEKFGNRWWFGLSVTVALGLSVLCLGVCFYLMVYARSGLMGGVWFSGLNSGNIVATESLNRTTVGLIFYILSSLVLGAGAFFRISKKPTRKNFKEQKNK